MNNSKLSKIQADILATENNLAKLQACDGDVDAVARECGVARDKIDLLKRWEAAERQRLEAKCVADRNMTRNARLKHIRGLIEVDLREDNQLIDGFVDAVRDAVRLAAARHELFNWRALEFGSAEMAELFTESERRQLTDALANTIQPIRVGDCAEIVKDALSDRSEQVRQSVSGLFSHPTFAPGVQHAVPKRTRSNPILDAVKILEGRAYPIEQPIEPDEAASEQPEQSGASFTADLRTGHVTNSATPTTTPAPSTEGGRVGSENSEFVGGAYG